MKPLALLAVAACAILFVAVSLHDHSRLPDRIASHFDATGTVNGWMDRTAFTVSMLAVGLGLPALLIALLYAVRFLPPQHLNIPNADYWRQPAHFRKACDYLLTAALWFAAAFLLWQTAFTHQIVAANLAVPPHLDSRGALLLTIPLLAFTLAWIAALVVRFSRTT